MSNRSARRLGRLLLAGLAALLVVPDLTGKGPQERQDPLSPREKQTLRWALLLDTSSGANYVEQIRSLGGYVLIPKKPEGGEYWLIRDLKKRPAELLDEDWAKLDRIRWFDSSPKSMRDVAAVLKLEKIPTHMAVLFPESLERKLLELEKNYKGAEVEKIFETRFQFIKKDEKYEPVVVSQTLK